MSTQRRKDRSNPATQIDRRAGWDISNPSASHGRGEIRNALRPAGRSECDGLIQVPVAQAEVAHATGTAASPVDLASFQNEATLSEAPAANSLQSDMNDTLFVGYVPKGTCRGVRPRAALAQHLPPANLPNRTTLPILRVSILSCRRYRQP